MCSVSVFSILRLDYKIAWDRKQYGGEEYGKPECTRIPLISAVSTFDEMVRYSSDTQRGTVVS